MDTKLFRISSAHDDWLVPWFRRFETEDGPGSMSVLNRVGQFGVLSDDWSGVGINDPSILNAEQYAFFMYTALQRSYDVAMVSVFARWGSDLIVPARLEKMRFVSLVVEHYRHSGVPIILAAHDLYRDGPKILLALEGADLIDELSDVDALFSLGIRCIALQYNRTNLVAGYNGLTSLGRAVVSHMFELGMIVDLAHSSLSVRKDILGLAESTGNGYRVFYTHGGTTESILCDELEHDRAVDRGLTPIEIQRILSMGGLVAFSPTKPFHQNAAHFAQTIASVARLLGGVNGLAIGTDFGGVSPSQFNDIQDIRSLSKVWFLLRHQYGLSDAQLGAIFQNNVPSHIQCALSFPSHPYGHHRNSRGAFAFS